MITRRSIRPLSASAISSWICPSCTKTSRTIQQNLLPKRNFAITSRRNVVFPDIAYHESFEQYGVPGLLSDSGYALAWTQYQSMLVRKLNQLTAGEPIEESKVKDLAINFAHDPMNASLFNHASMAFNNHFFFSTLSTVPKKLENVPALESSLTKEFGSIETLRSTMINTADAMFGPGFVWLVWTRSVEARNGSNAVGARDGGWRILCTYNAGTPFPEAGYRQQGIDMNSNNATSYNDYLSKQPVNTAGSFGRHSESGRQMAKLPPGGTTTIPVLCVNTWEHVWIYDFGLAGKRKFLEEWWNAVDWAAVAHYMPSEAKGWSRYTG